MKILFICKKDDFYAQRAYDFLKVHFSELTLVSGVRGEKEPEVFKTWEGDIIISYLSQWIIRKELLDKARIAAINFHPGSPKYPGIGCTNFAIYNEEKEFGITCHHMLPKVDTGGIISVRYFHLLANDTVWSLTQKCYAEILVCFYQVLGELITTGQLPKSDEVWQRKPYTRKELNEGLNQITSDMSDAEVKRRLKATTYDRPWAYVKIGGKKFIYDGK